MPKDKNVNIKLELDRDAKGKLRIVAHFNSKAPNIFINKNEYVWMPTLEEKDLINEAFNFMPSNASSNSSKTLSTDKTEDEAKKETKIEQEPEPEPEPEITEETEPSVFERIKDDAVFKVPDSEKNENDKNEEVKDPGMEPQIEVKKEEPSEDKKIEEDDGLIVEADEEAIREALKKHEKDDDDELDKAMREVDEKTIIDRVLSQKKKGKWSKKQ